MIYGIDASQPPPAAPPASPAQFIAVGYDAAFTSPILMISQDNDATNWIDRSSAAAVASSTAVLQAVAYSPSLDRWVAVGYDSSSFGDPRIMYSDDGGNTWAAATPDPTTDFKILGACWTGSNFIAVGVNSTDTDPKITISTDGITWTQQTSTPSIGMAWAAVAGISGLSVAVGYVDPTTPKLSSSTDDGSTWSAQTAPTGGQINGIVLVSGGTHVCAKFGDSTTNRIATSTNGTSWTNQTSPADQTYYSVAFNGTTYVVVGMDATTNTEASIATATNPTGTWTAQTPDPSSVGGSNGPNLLSVATNAAGGFVAVGRDNNSWSIPYIMYSAAGTTWIARTPAPSTNCVLFGVAGKT